MADLRNLNVDGPTVDEVRSSGVPICLLAGELDAVLTVETVRAAAALLPEARVEIVPGAPHSMYWEAPEAFNAALVRFLEQVFAQQPAGVAS
jgi:pimeloyl-ACP methyl ester carboxylesterase